MGEGGVWLVTTSSGDTLSKIDPARNEVVRSIPVRSGSSVVVVGFGSVWLATSPNDMVQRIDPVTLEVLATIPVGQNPRFMAIGEGALWVLNLSSGSVSRIDPASDRAVASIDIGGGFGIGDIAAGLGFVWTAAGAGPFSRIDPSTNAVVEQFQDGPHHWHAVGIGDDAVWISDHTSDIVYRFGP